MIGDPIRILNKAPWPLKVVKDGREHDIPMGESWLRGDLLLFAKEQNPVMGTENPSTTQSESFIAVIASDPKMQRDPLDLYDEETLKVLSKERINRSLLAPERQRATVGHRADFPKGRVGVESPTSGMHEPGQRF
jgi:hypothetical protein